MNSSKPLTHSKALRQGTSLLLAALERLSLEPGRRVAVAFSCGADSLALLALLGLLPRRRRLEVEAIHVDHGLRAESAEDARRAAQVARELGVPCQVVRLELDRRAGRGLEAVAREGRYRALAKAAAGRPILTAHSADDQAETVLYRLAKGTGTSGLVGIRPKVRLAGGLVMRPVLEIERSLLHEVVRVLDLPVVEDPSNQTRDFVRNRLRLDVLPALEAAIPGAAARLARAARHLDGDERYLSRRTLLARRRLEREGGVDAGGLLGLPRALRGRVVRELIEEAGGAIPTSSEVDRILGIAERGGAIHLSEGILGEAREGILRIAPGPTGRMHGTEPLPGASDKSARRAGLPSCPEKQGE